MRLHAPAVPTVPGADQGQGRALQRLPQGQLPGAPGGELRVIPGAWVDESSATWNQVAVAGAANAGWIDWIEPGMEARVDITSVVRGDGTITFVLVGAPDQIATIGSRESATPPRLEIVIEEGTAPGE